MPKWILIATLILTCAIAKVAQAIPLSILLEQEREIITAAMAAIPKGCECPEERAAVAKALRTYMKDVRAELDVVNQIVEAGKTEPIPEGAPVTREQLEKEDQERRQWVLDMLKWGQQELTRYE